MKRKLLLLSLSSLMSIPLISCSGPQEEGWDIKKDDYRNIIQFESQASKSDGKIKLAIDDEYGPFKNGITPEDVIVFDVSKLKDDDNSSYYNYKEYKACEINKDDFKVLEEGRGFEVKFDGNIDTIYGILINKDVLLKGEYGISAMDKTIKDSSRLRAQDDEEFIDEYIETHAEHKDYSVEFTEIGCYVAALIFSCMTGNVVSACTSVYGILSLLNSTFKPAEPSIQDVLNRLDDIDKKLDEITELIKKNQEQLVNEQLYTEAMIDKLTADQYQRDITAFVTDYVNPIDSLQRKHAQYVEASYKNLVKGTPGYINLHFNRNEKNELVLLSQSESGYDAAKINIQVPIEGYNNAKKFLVDHNDIVADGFTAELDKDIDASVEKHYGKEIPSNEISKENYRFYVNTAILDEFEKNRYTGEYGSEGYKEASEMMDKAITLMKRISGYSTGQSIFDSYFGRVKYMYNFAAECKKYIRNIIANIKFKMESFASMAETACRYAKINASELAKEYDKAIETIDAYHKAYKEMPETRSFITNTTINSQFMWAKYDAWFTNPSENPTFHKQFKTEQVDSFNWNMNIIHKTPIDLASKVLISKLDQSRIYTRYQMLLKAGLTEKTDYLDYLVESGGIHQNNYKAQQALIDAKWVGEDSYRILTNFEGITSVTRDDGIIFQCTSQGNPEGDDYFNVGSKYAYQAKEGNEYWSGEKARGQFIDARSTKELPNHLISAYARYSKAKWYMIDNEHWTFSNNPAGTYFYIMYQF